MRYSKMLIALLPLISAVTAATWPACTNPSVRKDWRALTRDEKANWIAAVNCLSKHPSDPNLTFRTPNGISGQTPAYNRSGSLYDDLVYIHIDLSPDIHSTVYFFTWHRWYVQVYENALRQYCGLTTPSPYWDWTLETNVQNSPLFTDFDSTSGLGGFGDRNNDLQLTNGGFQNFTLSYPVKHRLRRQYTQQQGGAVPTTFAPSYISNAVNGNAGNFQSFQNAIENGPHGPGHFVVGGDLAGGCPAGASAFSRGCSGPYWSANEPVFWLHHGMVDKVWFDWQSKSAANLKAFGGAPIKGQTITMDTLMPNDGFGTQVTVGDIMDTRGGFLCYVYQTTGQPVPGQNTTIVGPTTTTTRPTTTTTRPTTSVGPTTTSGPSGCSVAKYGQCGGQGYTGCTVCASGSTCTSSNQWYSQCL